MKLSLNHSNYILRAEKTRVALVRYHSDTKTIDKFAFIHPLAAIFIALLDGHKTIEQAMGEFTFINDIFDSRTTENFVIDLRTSLKKIFGDDVFCDDNYENSNSKTNKYDPSNFIINEENINLLGNKLDAPLDLNFIITQECNRECIYCFAEREYAPKFDQLSFQNIKKIIDDAKALKVHDIVFSGGEPFLRKDLIDIIEYTLSSGLFAMTSTKSYLSVEKCKRLKKIGLDFMQVSIDSMNQEIANYMVGSPGYLKDIKKTIINLLEANIFVSCHVVVTPYNVFSIPDLIKSLTNYGVSEVKLVNYGRSAFRHRDSLFLDDDAVFWLEENLEILKQTITNTKINKNFSGRTKELTFEEKGKKYWERSVCGTGRSSMTILPDGKVLACEQMPTRNEHILGDLTKQTITEVWNSQKLRSFLLPDKINFKDYPCYECKDFLRCNESIGRCFRDALNVYGSIYAPSPTCPLAPPAPRLS